MTDKSPDDAAPSATRCGFVALIGAPNVAAPTGTIAFSDGVTQLGSTAVGSDGRASLVARCQFSPASSER